MSVDVIQLIQSVPSNLRSTLIAKLLLDENLSEASVNQYVSKLIPCVSNPQEQKSALQTLLKILKSSFSLSPSCCEKLLTVISKLPSRPGIDKSLLLHSFQCLTVLIQKSENDSESGKLVSSLAPTLVKTIVENSLNISTRASLQLLATIMGHYPGSCGQLKFKIQEKLISMLSMDAEHVESDLIGKCFSLLPQVGGGGKEGTEHKKQFDDMFNSLLACVHKGISNLFANVREFDSYSSLTSIPTFNLPQVVGGQIEKNIAMTFQIERCMDILSHMISRAFPHSRLMPVDSVLTIQTRLLSLTVPDASTPTNELLRIQLDQLLVSSFNLLSEMIKIAKDQLLPEAASINSLVVSGLERLVSPSTRTGLYGLLSCWLEAVGSASGIELCARQIINCIIGDVSMSKDKISLTRTSVKKSRSKKHGKKTGSQGVDYKITKLPSSSKAYANNMVKTIAAFKSLGKIIAVVGPWLDRESFGRISAVVFSQLLYPDIQHSLKSCLISCLKSMLATGSPDLPSPGQIFPVVICGENHASMSDEVRSALLFWQESVRPTRSTLEIKNVTQTTIDAFNGVTTDEEELQVDVETVSVASQTQADTDSNLTKDKVSESEKRILELEKSLAVALENAKSLKGQLNDKISELSSMKLKRSVLEENQSSNVKKQKLNESEVSVSATSVDINPIVLPNTEDKKKSESSESLSVSEMLRDFSDKLNSNLITTTFADSDTD